MSIFRLYQKYMEINYYSVGIDEAEDYVKKCLKHIVVSTPQETKQYTIDSEKYKFKINIPQLDEYPNEILSYFTHYYHPAWLKDGITK